MHKHTQCVGKVTAIVREADKEMKTEHEIYLLFSPIIILIMLRNEIRLFPLFVCVSCPISSRSVVMKASVLWRKMEELRGWMRATERWMQRQ